MKRILIILTLYVSATNAQVLPGMDTAKYKPEILTSGFIDIMNNGQVNASARFVRLFIGEPGKISLPLSVYSGVSANNFQNSLILGQRSNDHLVNNFINPLSGLVNVALDGSVFFNRNRITRAGLMYQVGEKILTGYRMGLLSSPSTGRPVNFLNSYAANGFILQTGAWERNNASNVGFFWITIRYMMCYTNPKQLEEIMPGITTNGMYHGYIIGSGIDINNLLNLKIIYYKYLNQVQQEYGLPIYQFSFNYSIK